MRKEYVKDEEPTHNETNLSIKTIESLNVMYYLELGERASMQKIYELYGQAIGLSREEEGTRANWRGRRDVGLSSSFRTAERSMIVGSESTTRSRNSANTIR